MDRLKGRTLGVYRGQATGEDIWRFSRTGYWGEHLEVLEDGLQGRRFGGFRGQATWEDICRFTRTG